MKTRWALPAAILAVLSVPFVLALREDRGRPGSDGAAGSRSQAAAPADLVDAAAEPAAPERAAPVAAWEELPEGMPLSFFEEVFFAGDGAARPALPASAGGLAFGMSAAEVDAAAAELVAWVDGDSSRFPDAGIDLIVEEARNELAAVAIRFPDYGNARRLLADRWGSPTMIRRPSGDPAWVWIDAETSLRVLVQESGGSSQVRFEAFTPLEALLAAYAPERFASARVPRLGATAVEAAETLDAGPLALDAGRGVARREILGTEYSAGPATMEVEFERGRVAAVRFGFDLALHPAAATDLGERLERELGPARPVEAGLLYGGSPQLLLAIDEAAAEAEILIRWSHKP